MNRRTERVSGLLHQEVSRLLVEGLSDPRLARLVTVSHVEVTPDLQHATVKVTVLGDETQEREALKGLEAATGFLRRELGQRLKLRKTPEIRFALDSAIREGDRVLSLLDSLNGQETPRDG